MKPVRPLPRRRPVAHPNVAAQAVELKELRARLAEAEDTLRAIGSGAVDAVVVAGQSGNQVFTLQGADHVYRLLIESMNEGALTLTPEWVITYANRCFAQMIKGSLEQIVGSSFRLLLSAVDQRAFQTLMAGVSRSGSKLQLSLLSGRGSSIPVQVSMRALPAAGSSPVTLGVVVTDLTETRRTEELLRSLAQRVVQGHETERGRVALDLHDHVTQLLCANLFRCQALVEELTVRGGPSLKAAIRMRVMLGQTAGEVERISQQLRPGVLDLLGLEAVLRSTGREFEERSGLTLNLTVVPLSGRLPAGAGLAFYRMFEEALRNVEHHARARQVSVDLREEGAVVRLTIRDDGLGFDPERLPARRRGKPVLGLLGMRERAAAVGGAVAVSSGRGIGTEIVVSIPLLPSVAPSPTAVRRRSPVLTR